MCGVGGGGAAYQDGESEDLAFCLCSIPSGADLSKALPLSGSQVDPPGVECPQLKFFCKLLDSGIPWTLLLIQSL